MNLDWKRAFNLGHEEVFGLDIGSSAVRAVQMHKDDNNSWVVTAAGIAQIADGTKGNDSSKEVNTIGAINRCLQSTGIQTRLAVCGVSGSEVAVRSFKFPALPPEEIEGAIMLEAEQICPFNVNDGVVDYQLIEIPKKPNKRLEEQVPEDENSVCGVLVAATNKLIERKVHLAEEAHLDSVLMDVDGLALLNCFNECEKSKTGRPVAILNIGSSFTNLAIVGDDLLPFVRDIAYSGEMVIKEIAAENNVSTEAVHKLLFSPESLGETKFEIDSSLAKACQKLIVDVNETLRYFAAREKSVIIEKILVCGRFAVAKGLVELLNSKFPARTVLWNPFDKIACDGGQDCRDILRKNGPEMAVAAGFAMRSI